MDYFYFLFIVLLSFAALHVWMPRTGREPKPPVWLWLAVLCLLTAGWFYTRAAGLEACRQIRQMVEGFPPTYAEEAAKAKRPIPLSFPNQKKTWFLRWLILLITELSGKTSGRWRWDW